MIDPIIRRFAQNVTVCLLLVLFVACSGRPASLYTLSLVHLNDTHSHMEPHPINMTAGDLRFTVMIGGAARIKTAVDDMRRENRDLLLLHAGDAVQGTLYFTLFNGALEYDFLNMLGVDAMTFGNHEFDRGVGAIPGWIKRSHFPWLSANIDFTGEPDIAVLVKPYLVKEIKGEKVAIIGVTTEATPQITRDVGKVLFIDAVVSVHRQVEALSAYGINKIILLSHLGYSQDKALAAKVSGIDVIVGGHSHSLLGDADKLAAVGLAPGGGYPTEVKALDGNPVLVLQAWQWGHALGRIQVKFTPEGRVAAYSNGIVLPVGDQFSVRQVPVAPDGDEHRRIMQALKDSAYVSIVKEDPDVLAWLAPYASQVAAYRKKVLATATSDLIRGVNSGPGPLMAEAMMAAVTGARAALLNYGGVRKDLLAGPITVADVLEVLPFAHTLMLIDLTGEEIKEALEGGVDFLLGRHPTLKTPVMPYVAGLSFSVRPAAPKGSRIVAVSVKDTQGFYQPVDPQMVYRIVTNSFVVGGGDGFDVIKKANRFRVDTGLSDSAVFGDYLSDLGLVHKPTQQLVVIVP